MVTKSDVDSYQVAFANDADVGPIGGTAKLHIVLWSVFFALATVGGLLS